MSRVKLEAIWQHEKVLPYILTTLKDKIDNITAVEKIFLFGSRGRVPFADWETLEGKDWDVLVQAKCKLKNAYVLIDKDYYLDLLVLDEETIREHYSKNKLAMIFPENDLSYVISKTKDNG
ncbi:hypothetical protein [Chryseobacterium polytrichastri]|uniref:Nucleotidyltransferase domain-containing protein n=1 Tax=Chryseobacterium polytrichastri TaxID=1302687 RepID=A0A1M7AFI5_9FLAO|nr:hypothetical protein [Chryseobacterium polytrichastri]SHL41376.1 hypothetical protein SAMN05444267_101772 [Chryseobacterium polytrichastri]